MGRTIDRLIMAELIDRYPLSMDSADVRDIVRNWPTLEFNRAWNSYVCALANINPAADARNATQRKKALV